MPAVQPLRSTDPRRVGPYKLTGRIGAGGMGTVFHAETPDGRVAVKIVRPELADDDMFRQRFRREVELARRLDGRFTATVIAADADAGVPYLVTTFIDGPNLAELVTTGGPLGRDMLIGLAAGLADGLRHIHSLGLVHRDVKPSNVLIATDGPKLIDFGIAYAAEATALTRTGIVSGSPQWMAPEQVDGRTVGAAADMFSWGSTVAFAGTGRPPFGDGRPDAVMYRIVHGEPDLEGLDPAVADVVAAAMQADPAARPTAEGAIAWLADQTVADVGVGDVDAWATSVVDRTWHAAPAATMSAPVVPATKAASSRTRRLFAAAVAAIVVVAGGIVVARGGDDPQPIAAADTTTTTAEAPTSTTTAPTTTAAPTTTTTTTPDPATVNVAAQLPQFHDEVERLVVDRDGPDAIVVVSAPRQDEPRPLAVTLFEFDRGGYVPASMADVDCGFTEDIVSDPDGALFIGCTGGATAHYVYAFIANELDLVAQPQPSEDGYASGWLTSGWEILPVAGQPDDIVLNVETCIPDCLNSGYDRYRLNVQRGFDWWDVVACNPLGEAEQPTRRFNATVDGGLLPSCDELR